MQPPDLGILSRIPETRIFTACLQTFHARVTRGRALPYISIPSIPPRPPPSPPSSSSSSSSSAAASPPSSSSWAPPQSSEHMEVVYSCATISDDTRHASEHMTPSPGHRRNCRVLRYAGLCYGRYPARIFKTYILQELYFPRY